MDDRVVKIYIEEGVEASLYSLGTEVVGTVLSFLS